MTRLSRWIGILVRPRQGLDEREREGEERVRKCACVCVCLCVCVQGCECERLLVLDTSCRPLQEKHRRQDTSCLGMCVREKRVAMCTNRALG